MFHLQANVAQHYFEASALEAETFQVVDYVGEEHISRPFEFTVNLVSDDPEIQFADVINQPATLATLRGEERVPVHGLVADFRQGGRTADRFGYRAILVPRLWRCSLTFQSRIFQHMTLDAIVGQVLEEAGLAGQDVRFDLTGRYPEREYCVQYQETDLAFVSRLLEHEGIHYFFAHEDRDVLVMTDARSGNPRIPGADAVTYNAGAGMAPGAEAVREFVCREQVVTGKVLLKDYNYRTPETNLQAEAQASGEMPGLRYEYGQHFADQGEGDRLAQVRGEEIACQRRVLLGEGNCAGLRSGHVFALEDHYRSDLNDDYLITRVQHVGTQGAALPGLSEMENGEASVYRNEFTGVPADGPYRPPRRTPVPHVPGIMTARTETAGGDYAYLDEEGRYRAKMHFDASEVTDGEATRPIRKAQPYSGPGYGIHFPEHADTEMVWACVDGNPDRPLALATVPNPSQASPSVAANKQQNVIRTWGQHELTFDDASGSENIYLHSTKDWTIDIANDKNQTVGNDESLSVGSNRDKVVGVDQTEAIGANKTIQVGGNHSETIGGSMTQNVGIAKAENIAAAKSLAIGGAYQVTVGAAMNETVGGAKTEEVGAFKGEAVGGNKSEGIGGSKSLTTGKNLAVTVGDNYSINVGDSQALSVVKNLDEKVGGDHHEQVTKEWAVNAKKIQLMAEDQIVLKTGKAEIIMKKNGDIIIKGKKIQVKGSGDVVIKGSKIKEN